MPHPPRSRDHLDDDHMTLRPEEEYAKYLKAGH